MLATANALVSTVPVAEAATLVTAADTPRFAGSAYAVTLMASSFLVPYSKLFLSPNNVRAKTSRKFESVRSLAAMIEADGLLSDLQVSEERDGEGQPTGRWGVEAGGRRWMAIGLLISERRWPEDAPVGCKRVAPGRATGVSLAENISQERMHPADEFAAFAKLIGEGKTVEQVAQHFGVKTIDVQRRMKLAKVAPALVARFRQGEITLDQLTALASTDDQKRQLAVWKALPEYQRSASSIRKRLTEDEISARDPRVKLIGIDRYKASGGTLRFDLFTEDSFLEAGLVELITAEVLTEAAERVEAEGWAWVAVVESMGYEERQRFAEPPAKYRPETDAERTQRDAWETRLDELGEQYDTLVDAVDDGGPQAREALEAIDRETVEVQAKISALQSARIDTTGYDKKTLGAVVTIDAGVLVIKRGVMLAKDAQAEQQRQRAIGQGAVAGSADRKVTEFSEKLMADLTSHRTAAMQAALAGNVPVALAVLADRLCADAFRLRGGFGFGGNGSDVLQISLKQCDGALAQNATRLGESEAGKRLLAQREHWTGLLPTDAGERLSWLLSQPQEIVLALIAFCTASSADVIARRADFNRQADAIASALRLDMADWWSVGVDNFLAQTSKARIAAAVTEACGTDAAAPLMAMKKGDACAKAAAFLAGTRWLPTPLRLVGDEALDAVKPASQGA